MARTKSRVRGKRPQRQEARKGLIVTEGIVTEPEYLSGLRQHYRLSSAAVDIIPFKVEGVGKDPLTVVQKALDLSRRQEYDWIACLVDVDEHAKLETAVKTAKEEDILLVISNLKFEVWLLWHVSGLLRVMSSHELDKAVKDYDLVVGKKGKNLNPSFPYAEHVSASRVAFQADPDLNFCRKGPKPSTAMPLLVRKILGD